MSDNNKCELCDWVCLVASLLIIGGMAYLAVTFYPLLGDCMP